MSLNNSVNLQGNLDLALCVIDRGMFIRRLSGLWALHQTLLRSCGTSYHLFHWRRWLGHRHRRADAKGSDILSPSGDNSGDEKVKRSWPRCVFLLVGVSKERAFGP